MTSYLAFLRGINLGNRRVKMDVLRAHFEELKFADVETFIASGNLSFTAKSSDAARLESQIEKHLASALGYEVDTFLRTRAELAAVVAHAPFPPAELADPANTLHIGFFRAPLPAPQARAFAALHTAHDSLHLCGREYYWLCRDIKSHESKLWTSPAMRALKIPTSSMRNVTTLRKLSALYPHAPV